MRKFLSSLVALALLISSAAASGILIDSYRFGVATPLTISDLGNNVGAGAATTLTTGTSITASTGDWLVAIIAADNSGTNGDPSISSVTDSQSNTWTQRAIINQDPGAAAAGTTLGIYTGVVANALSGGTVTVNFSPTTTGRAVQVYRVQPAAGESVEFVAADATGNASSTTTHDAPTVSVNNGETIFGASAIESNAAITGDGDTTNGSWSAIITRLATNGVSIHNACSSQYKTVNADGNQSWAATTAGAQDSARTYLILRPSL